MKMATMRELDDWYSIEDVYDMLEIAKVDAHNARMIRKAQEEG